MPRIEAPTLAEHQALRRSALVQAAAQILAVDGPHAITPAAVAAMAGLARSSTYQYFPSTAALIRAGVEEFFRAAMERIETEVPAEGAPMDRIEAYIASTLDSAVSGHTAMMRLSSLDLPRECHDRVRELHDQFGDIVGAALVDCGALDPEVLTPLVTGLVQAGARQVAEGVPAERVRRVIMRLIRGACPGC